MFSNALFELQVANLFSRSTKVGKDEHTSDPSKAMLESSMSYFVGFVRCSFMVGFKEVRDLK